MAFSRLRWCFVTVFCATSLASEAGVASDVKYIKCDTCKALVLAAHAQVGAARTGKAALSEEAVQVAVESMCKPETDEGAWLRRLDIVEKGLRLAIERQVSAN